MQLPTVSGPSCSCRRVFTSQTGLIAVAVTKPVNINVCYFVYCRKNCFSETFTVKNCISSIPKGYFKTKLTRNPGREHVRDGAVGHEHLGRVADPLGRGVSVEVDGSAATHPLTLPSQHSLGRRHAHNVGAQAFVEGGEAFGADYVAEICKICRP